MAADKRWILSRVPPGPGSALDLAGGPGKLYAPLSARGYRYVNLDLAPSGAGDIVVGDAHDLPFDAETFDLVVCDGSLEHFHTPLTVFREIARVLKPGGRLVTWGGFMHPYHTADPDLDHDYYRYTRLGLEHLLREAELRVVSIEAPLGLFTIGAEMLIGALRRIGFGSLECSIERLATWLDGRVRPGGWNAYAASHLLVAVKHRAEADTE